MVLITSEALKSLGDETATKGEGSLNDRAFVSFCGATPAVLRDCWDLIKDEDTYQGGKLKHLLWGCMHMKLHLPEDVLCVPVGTSKPTLRKWAWKTIESLALASRTVIDWDKWKRNPPANALCCVSMDGTDFKIQEPCPFDSRCMSHKFNGAALKCEVGMSIFSGDMVWLCGPHRGGKHDLAIFREELKGKLSEGEMVEADAGYQGEPDWIRAKEDCVTRKERREKGRIRNGHEPCNRRFKVRSVLKQEYRHDPMKHGLVFCAIATITQVAIDDGSCLFGCEPAKSKKRDEPHNLDDHNLEE